MNDKEILRSKRVVQRVNLKDCFGCPDNFEIYKRNNRPYLNEIDAYEKQANYLFEIGCTNSGNKIKARANHLKYNLDNCYYGFNIISVTKAFYILLKLCKMPDTCIAKTYPTNTPEEDVFDEYFLVGADELSKSVLLGEKDSISYFIEEK